MDCRMTYIPLLRGEAAVVDMKAFIPTPDRPYPPTRVIDFLTLGPFVLETDGAFETEYFYEREKTLARDYLSSCGGERAARPILGQRVKNDYYGPEYLSWRKGFHKWDMLRFDRDEEACDEALYVTPQRNCVYYAAVYVRCEADTDAIVSYENSGCLLFLNGELIDSQPYGRVKSLTTTGHQVAVTFKEGLNLLLFKLRTGYIADTMDMSMSHLSLHPVMLRRGALGLSWPIETNAFETGPAQCVYALCGAFGAPAGPGKARFEAEGAISEAEIPPLAAGRASALRLSLPAGHDARTVGVRASLLSEGGESVCAFSAPVRPAPALLGHELMFSDFHFDTTYHQEQRTYALGAFYIVKCMLERMRREPDFKVVFSEIDYLHPFLSLYPEYREELLQAFRAGRAEADCFYNQPNELTSSGEALARNMIYGQNYHMAYLGQRKMVFAPGDVFGHPNQMSQLIKKGECEAARWGKIVLGLDNAFHHISPDGTDMLHIKDMRREDAQRLNLSWYTDGAEVADQLPAYPAEDGMRWTKNSLTDAQYGHFTDLAEGIAADEARQVAEKGRSDVPLTSRDLTQHHSGVLLTRLDFKQANRLIENRLITAEKLSAICALHGAPYPEKALDWAWRQLLCAQHHDSVTGTNNEISFVDLMLEYREALTMAEDVIKAAQERIAAHAGAPSGERALFVFNPHPWDRTEGCLLPAPGEGAWEAVDAAGHAYPLARVGEKAAFIAGIPAMGYKMFALRRADGAEEASTDAGCVIENEYLRLKVDPSLGGGIVSLLDKRAGREVIDMSRSGPGNRIAVLREVPDRMETQHEFYTTGQKLFSSEGPARVTRTVTPLYQRLNIVTRLDIVAVARQTITLWKGAKRVDFETVIEDYQGRDDLFTVTFPTTAGAGKGVYDDRFAPHVCGKSLRPLSFQTHQFIGYSHSRIAPANQWFELGPTAQLRLNGEGALQIGMTALIRREGGGAMDAADRLMRALTKKAIPVTAYPEGEQHGGWKLIHFNEDIDNTDTRFVLCLADEAELAYAAALKSRMDGAQRAAFEAEMARRGRAALYAVDDDNALHKAMDVILLIARDAETLSAWVEEMAAPLEAGHAFALDGVVTVSPVPREDDYGVALLNDGNIACSVEGAGMLNMMLFHTADFYGNMGRVTGGNQLIPEQKTCHARYALYPHAGSWREAEVYREAAAFNDPMYAFERRAAAEAVLPAEKSYLRMEGPFALTCFKAGGYDMSVMSRRARPISERGIALRLFETDGLAQKARLETGFGAEKARRVNILERGDEALPVADGAISLAVGGHAIETLLLDVKGDNLLGKEPLLAEKEGPEPVYIRSWEHDRGSMPMGYLAVAGFISRHVIKGEDGALRTEISMANNQKDAACEGLIRLECEGGLTCDTAEIPYNLDPMRAKTWPVTVKGTEGLLRMTWSDDGQAYTDTLWVGRFDPEMTLTDCGDHLTIEIKNDTNVTLKGALELASPIETWFLPANPHAMASLPFGPWGVDIAPGGLWRVDAPYTAPKDGVVRAFWAVAKLMIDGNIYFAYVHRKGERHNYWTNEFWPVLAEDGGSLRKLYQIHDV